MWYLNHQECWVKWKNPAITEGLNTPRRLGLSFQTPGCFATEVYGLDGWLDWRIWRLPTNPDILGSVEWWQLTGQTLSLSAFHCAFSVQGEIVKSTQMQNATKSKESQRDPKTYCIKLNYVQYQGIDEKGC